VPVTVAAEASTTAFSTFNANLIPSTSTTYSDFFFFQASVAGASNQGAATGTVTFSDSFNGTVATLMTVPLSIQGSALVQETSLAVGTHTLTASYSGDPSFKPSASSTVTVIVAKGITQTFLLVPSGAPPNSPVTLAAAVFPQGVAAPTGTVQFFSGTQAIGNSVKVQNFFATLTTTQLANGSNSITAVYSGDANFNGSTSQASILFIGNPDFQIAVNPGNVTVSASTPGTTTLLVSPGPGLGFAGTVSFTCAGLPAGAACSVQPAQLNLDGFNSASTQVTITKSATGAVRLFPLGHQRLFGSSAAALSLLFLVFLGWARKKRSLQLCASMILICVLSCMAGCGGGSTPPANPGVPISAVVTLTASGTSSFPTSTVSHTVTLAVTLQ
jgi:trimeric autotransporter adhesin